MKRALVLLGACGMDPDIPLPDGPFEPGQVSVAVTTRGLAAVNVPVIFQNADSEVVFATVTDFDGKAHADLDGAAFVTVIEPRDAGEPRSVLSTFAGVQGGDELHLDLAPLGRTEVSNFRLKIEQDLGTPTALSHLVFTTCGPVDGASFIQDEPVQLVGCNGVADMLVVSVDDLGTPLRSQFRRGVQLDGIVDFTVTPMPYEDFQAATIAYDNIPTEVSFIGAYRGFATDAQQVVFELTLGVVPAETNTAEIRVPTMSGAIAIASTNTIPFEGEVGTQSVLEWETTTAGDYTLDLGGAMLPRYTEPPVFDPARRTATWVEGGGGTEPDTVRMRIQIHRPEVPVGPAWEWRLLGPRTGASLTFPKLPIDAAGFDFNPLAGDTVTVRELTTAKLPTGFDKAVRERGFIPFSQMRSGASGRIVTQDLLDQEPIGEPEL